MNKNQVKGAAKDVEGKIQKTVGNITGSNKDKAVGAAKEVAGKIQKGVGDAQEDLKNAKRKHS